MNKHNTNNGELQTPTFTLEQPLDGYIQLSPVGLFPHTRGLQKVDRPALENLVKNFKSFFARLGRRFAGLPFYVGHPDVSGFENAYSDRKAYGWIMDLQVRDDGLYGRTKWSDAGRELIASGHYKFLSPTWTAEKVGMENGRPVYRPTQLVSVGLTNDPNLPVPPLANSDPGKEGDETIVGLPLPVPFPEGDEFQEPSSVCVGNSKEAATPPATPAFDFAPHLARMNVIEANVEHCKRQIAELSERLITNMLDTAVANARILPLHGRIEANNLSTPGTPEWRVNASAQYNNIWQLEHQIGVSYGFSPEKFKTEGLFDDYIFNRPQVAYYGAYYRVPLGSAPSVAEEISGSSQFGYNEATHEFRLPPVGGRPDLSFFASASSSDTGVKFGSETVVSRTPLLTIVSRDAGQNLSVNESAGARFNYPLALNDNHRLNLSAGPDLKRYELKSFNTNNFIVTTVVTNLQGSQTIQSIVASPQPVRENATTYLPISLGADYSGADKHGSSSAGIALIGNVVGNSDDFSALAYSREAKPTYLRGTVSISRDQKLPADWSLLLRANGQMASGPLLNTEQLALGGLGNVRGYFEGDEYGDAGWFGSAELRTPFLQSRVPTWNNFVPIWLRGSFFLDAGQRFLLDSANHSSRTLLGTGFGVSANINNALDMRISVGIPLIDSANTVAGDPHAYFSVGGQF